LHEVQFFAATYICIVHQKLAMLVKLVMPLLRVGRKLLQEHLNVINAHCLIVVSQFLCISVQYKGIRNLWMDTGLSLTKNYEQFGSLRMSHHLLSCRALLHISSMHHTCGNDMSSMQLTLITRI
jgi:hypothetical protein